MHYSLVHEIVRPVCHVVAVLEYQSETGVSQFSAQTPRGQTNADSFGSGPPKLREGSLMLKGTVVATVVVAVSLGSALAQSDELPSTKLMKDQGQTLYRGLNSMVKGDAPHDQAKVDELFVKLIATASRIAAAFPESSKGKSPPAARYAASPKVWENKAEFSEHIANLKKALEDNRAKASTLEGLKAAYTAINSACNSCHQDFRLRKS
jgi:cytochrome c556